ncbi:LysR family transcriptional regulator [Roseibium alexandrii]|nr:LysR family transcriptional regulator [Roseibium alexandrii]
MSELSKSELRRLDLTLLLVFLGLLKHRKAMDVAHELGLTQSAISQALKRLREVFGDELFLRRPHGMEPTATALALQAPIANAVETLRQALGVARAFDPRTATGQVRLAAMHAEQAVLIPALAARLRNTAPGLDLSVVPRGRREAMQSLQDGEVDLALGFFRNVPKTCRAEVLYEDTYLVAGSPQTLSLETPLNLETYCAMDHILTSPSAQLHGVVDTHLEKLGRQRRVVLGLPAFVPALAAAAASDALITLPARVAEAFAGRFGLVTCRPPLDIPSFPVSVVWHRRNDSDPQTQWIRSQLNHCDA